LKVKDGSPGGIALDGVRCAHATEQPRKIQTFLAIDSDIKRYQSIDLQVDMPSFCGIFAQGLPPMQDATARNIND
jgi:hypothetical protein